VVWERRAPSPMLDIALFRNPRFTASSAAISLAFFALFGMIFFLTQYMQMVKGYDALDAGIKTLPVAAGLIFAGPSSTKLTERIGLRFVVPLGLLFVAGGMYLISLADASSSYGLIAAALVLLGYGIGTAMAPATDAIMGTLPEAKMSVGSAINDTTRVAGGSLGVAILGSLLASGYRGDMDAIAGAPDVARDSLAGALATGNPQLIAAGQDAFMNAMQTATLVAVGVALVGALIAAVFLPGEKRVPAGEVVPA
jgi:predicted MFS family arabinose efflux permease